MFLATGLILYSADRGENWIDYQTDVTGRVEHVAVGEDIVVVSSSLGVLVAPLPGS